MRGLGPRIQRFVGICDKALELIGLKEPQRLANDKALDARIKSAHDERLLGSSLTGQPWVKPGDDER
jgi:hypothetical protein